MVIASGFWRKIADAWPVFVTIATVTVTLYVNVRILDFRVGVLEQQQKDGQQVIREVNEKLGRLEVLAARLVAIQEEQAKARGK
jgi:hypothetical protein